MKKVYRIIRKITPSLCHSLITSFLYDLKIKPTINQKGTSPFERGIVVLSADFEMAWAYRYSKKKHDVAETIGLHERENVLQLISLFDNYRIPITWATVGHLFLESCDKHNKSLSHSGMPRPDYFENSNWSYTEGDWYDSDPCSDFQKAPAWYAPDLIDKILTASAKHEIGCHTFSHIDCTPKNCSKDLMAAELEQCIRLAEKKGIKLKSMVFPGGTHGNYSLLKEYGFTSYRKPTDHDIDLPVIDEFGLVQIPCSYSLDKSQNSWTAETYIKIAKSFVDCAIKSKKVAHLWFHPSIDSWYLQYVLPPILSYIHEKGNDGQIDILTMEQLTERILKVEQK